MGYFWGYGEKQKLTPSKKNPVTSSRLKDAMVAVVQRNVRAVPDIRDMLEGDLDTFLRKGSCFSKKMIHVTFLSALHNGHMDCIRYMVENRLVSLKNKPYCDIAARKGNYECLRYLHENGCGFNRYTAMISLIRQDHRCLRYIMENGGTLNMPDGL